MWSPGDRVSNRQVLAVATLFAVVVGATALAGTVFSGYRTLAGLAIVGCIAAYAVFGSVLVYSAGTRL